jgi:hypothetical protein
MKTFVNEQGAANRRRRRGALIGHSTKRRNGITDVGALRFRSKTSEKCDKGGLVRCRQV